MAQLKTDTDYVDGALCAPEEKGTGQRDAKRSARPPAPSPDPVYVAPLSPSAAAGANSAPGNWATASGAWLPTPAPSAIVATDSTHRLGRRLSREPLPG
jgi:hypothetical protein